MSYDWKKNDKAYYLPKNEPSLITIPAFKCFLLDGRGDPNGEDFAEAVGVLYSLSYAVKMLPKKGPQPEGYYDYSVFPLEGVWDLAEEARGKETLDKSSLLYTLMIRQPDFVTEELADAVIQSVRRKKPHPLLSNVHFGLVEDGLCVQMLHLGPFDSEPASFARMEAFCAESGLNRSIMTHREIYLSDARKTPQDKLKTVLRFQADPKD